MLQTHAMILSSRWFCPFEGKKNQGQKRKNRRPAAFRLWFSRASPHLGLYFYVHVLISSHSDSLTYLPWGLYLPYPCFNQTDSPLRFLSPALSNSSHVTPTHSPSYTCIKCNARYTYVIKTSTPVQLAHSHQQGVPMWGACVSWAEWLSEFSPPYA